eukprot:746848-Hanusia_phi.AAC.1
MHGITVTTHSLIFIIVRAVICHRLNLPCGLIGTGSMLPQPWLQIACTCSEMRREDRKIASALTRSRRRIDE